MATSHRATTSASKRNKRSTSTKRSKPPWERANPRKRAGKSSVDLTPAQEAAAKAMAKRAGRPYPNLVDNMRMAKKVKAAKAANSKTAKSAKSKTAKRTRKAAAKTRPRTTSARSQRRD